MLDNDSDPNGYPVSLAEELGEVTAGAAAVVEGRRIVVTAPEEDTTVSVRYTIDNGHGGRDTAVLRVAVTPTATISSPTAVDQVVEAGDVVGERVVTVDPRAGAANPNGPVDGLRVSVEGANADAATVAEDGTLSVRRGDRRTVITYRLSSGEPGADDERSAAAFVIVPPYSDGVPPELIPGLPEQVVEQGQTRQWRLDDLVRSPTGKAVRLTGADGVSSVHSDGESSYVDEGTLRFTPAQGYRGPASITMTVSDGSRGGTSVLILPITVGDPDMTDMPPGFTPPTLTVEAGEEPVSVDLRDSTTHPNPDELSRVSYGELSGGGEGVEVSLSGSRLTASAPFGTPAGTATTVTFSVRYGDFVVEGEARVRVVSSTREPPVAVADRVDDVRPGQVVDVPVTANDQNPFPDRPLRLLEARVEAGEATASVRGSEVRVTAGATRTQTVSVLYRIGDATGDREREATGRVELVVTDVPSRPAAPELSAADGEVTATIATAPATNGSPITEYRLRTDDGKTATLARAGQSHRFDVTNGHRVSVTVVAVNAVGASAESEAATATAYGRPGAVSGAELTVTGDRWVVPTELRASWSQPHDTGGRIDRYEVRYDGRTERAAGDARSLTLTASTPGTAKAEVRACGAAGSCGPWSATNTVTTRDADDGTPTVESLRAAYRGQNIDFSGRWEFVGTVRHWQERRLVAGVEGCRFDRWVAITDPGPVTDVPVSGATGFRISADVDGWLRASCGIRLRFDDGSTSPAFDARTGERIE